MAKASIQTDLSLDTTRFQRNLARSQNMVKKFAATATAQIVRFGAAFAGIGLIKNIIRLGTASAETANKFKAVFGKAADGLDGQLNELKKTIPATMEELRGSLATLGQMGRAFGLNEDAANALSVELLKITGDLASFNNMRFEDAFNKTRSAITGEFEPLKQLGIVINETRLKQESLNAGIWDGTGAMSAAQKALTVHSILIRDMGEAHGDAAETAGDAANKIKFLKTQLTESLTEIGQTSLPAILEIVKAMARLAEFTDATAKAAGRLAGYLAFGNPDTLNERSTRGLAEKQLVNEGAISEKAPEGFFKGKARKERARLIEERAKLLMSEEAAEKTDKEADAISNLNAKLETQNDLEKDPGRKKAMEDRLDMYQQLIDKAGKLNSEKSTSIALTKAQREAEKLFEKGDANRDGLITGREKRAKEREKRKKETEERRRMAMAVAAEGSRFVENRTFGTASTAGIASISGAAFSSKSLDGMAAKPGQSQEIDKGTNQVIERLQSIDERLSKLDGAISG